MHTCTLCLLSQLVRSPVMSDKMVRLLLTMLAPQLGVAKRVEDGGRGALAPTMQRPGVCALSVQAAPVACPPCIQSKRERVLVLPHGFSAQSDVCGLTCGGCNKRSQNTCSHLHSWLACPMPVTINVMCVCVCVCACVCARLIQLYR